MFIQPWQLSRSVRLAPPRRPPNAFSPLHLLFRFLSFPPTQQVVIVFKDAKQDLLGKKHFEFFDNPPVGMLGPIIIGEACYR